MADLTFREMAQKSPMRARKREHRLQQIAQMREYAKTPLSTGHLEGLEQGIHDLEEVDDMTPAQLRARTAMRSREHG